MTIIGSEEVQLLKIARKRAKATHCMLCGQRMSSLHNSHSVPQMILRSITEEGWALKTDVILDPSERTERGEGLNRIGTFFLICKVLLALTSSFLHIKSWPSEMIIEKE